MDSIVELFNRSGAFLDTMLKKNPDKFGFVDASFKILNKIHDETEGTND